MKRQTRSRYRYIKAPKEIGEAIEKAEIIRDFLPDPDQLVLKEDTVKVTLTLSKSSVEFLKKKAKEKGVTYQTLVKRILDSYARH